MQNYMPICLTQIEYKIWPTMHTGKLIRNLHLMTGTENMATDKDSPRWLQYKNRTMCAIRNKGPQILLMGLPEAFGAINRTQLWTALYKKGIPLVNIPQIRKGRQNTNLRATHRVDMARK